MKKVILFLILCISVIYATNAQNTFTVSNLNDEGTGSLRQAITDANAVTTGTRTISFGSDLSGNINLITQLPKITKPVTIDGNLSVTINASGLKFKTVPANTNSSFLYSESIYVFHFTSTAANSYVKNLKISGFNDKLESGDYESFSGNFYGIYAEGQLTADNCDVRNNSISLKTTKPYGNGTIKCYGFYIHSYTKGYQGVFNNCTAIDNHSFSNHYSECYGFYVDVPGGGTFNNCKADGNYASCDGTKTGSSKVYGFHFSIGKGDFNDCSACNNYGNGQGNSSGYACGFYVSWSSNTTEGNFNNCIANNNYGKIDYPINNGGIAVARGFYVEAKGNFRSCTANGNYGRGTSNTCGGYGFETSMQRSFFNNCTANNNYSVATGDIKAGYGYGFNVSAGGVFKNCTANNNYGQDTWGQSLSDGWGYGFGVSRGGIFSECSANNNHGNDACGHGFDVNDGGSFSYCSSSANYSYGSYIGEGSGFRLSGGGTFNHCISGYNRGLTRDKSGLSGGYGIYVSNNEVNIYNSILYNNIGNPPIPNVDRVFSCDIYIYPQKATANIKNTVYSTIHGNVNTIGCSSLDPQFKPFTTNDTPAGNAIGDTAYFKPTNPASFDFLQPQYIISSRIDDKNGNINFVGDSLVTKGDNIVYTIIPNNGYQIDQVLINGVNNIEAVINGTYTFNNITDDHNIVVSFRQASGIDKIKTSETYLKAYPNPIIGDEITVEIDESKALTINRIDIYDMIGKIINTYPTTGKITTMPVSQLPKGAYFIKAGTEIVKIIK